MLQTLGRLSLLVSTALLATTAHAAVIYAPSSIVQSQDGSYITDTVNNLDWYKFSNAQNTVGMSMNEVNSFIAGTSWSVASIAQVQGLQRQFGWTADTLYYGYNDNYALTYAMAESMGKTAIGSFEDADDGYTTAMTFIQAMVSESEQQVVNGQLLEYHQTTASITKRFLNAQSDPFAYFGDYVDASERLQLSTAHDNVIGTWLSRAHVADGGGAAPDCGRLAPCPPNDVPEPASFALVGVALLGLGVTRRRRSE